MRIRVRISLSSALSFLLLSGVSLCSAQTSVPAPAPTPAPPASVPAATPASPDTLPAMPPFAQQQAQPPAAVPAPKPGPPPQVNPPATSNTIAALNSFALPDDYDPNDQLGSAYIPMDSWVYPAMLRLYSLGYLDSAFLSMRPYTRRSALHILQDSEVDIQADANDQAVELLVALKRELIAELSDSPGLARGSVSGLHSVYTRVLGLGGTPLHDSYHLGQSIINDYGRPYQPGFNNVTGFSTLNEIGRFSLFFRGEYQHAPGGEGYSFAVAQQLSIIDAINPYAAPNRPQSTILEGTQFAQNPFRILEANLSFHALGHEISFGKSDSWLGPGAGAAMAWTNNAENMYAFRINRVAPLNIFLLSKILGPVRYEFFVGSLKGHTFFNDPWAHSSMFSFRPTKNFEFAFQRTVIWGGKGHVPITIHSFLKSFFDISDTTQAEKIGRTDPGARYSDFSASYRLPFVRDFLTFYIDTIAHDDVTPISAPRRAAMRPGIYLSQFPGLHKLDLRVEAVSTDPPVARSTAGSFNYYEIIQRQGYTNKGNIMGDWIGREAKGGQAWLTWHLSGNESIQLEYLNKKTPKDFIPGGTTQNSFTATVVKRIMQGAELKAWVQYEKWKAPIYKTGPQSDTTAAFQITFYPKLKSGMLPY